MTEEERHNREIFSRTGALYAQFLDHQDEKRADQLAAIMKKAADEEVYIAFTGHYSAGKSSLLNTLLGEDILPTSPIPTSANLVVIRHGEDKVVLHTTDGAYAEIKGSYDKNKCSNSVKTVSKLKRWKSMPALRSQSLMRPTLTHRELIRRTKRIFICRFGSPSG